MAFALTPRLPDVEYVYAPSRLILLMAALTLLFCAPPGAKSLSPKKAEVDSALPRRKIRLDILENPKL